MTQTWASILLIIEFLLITGVVIWVLLKIRSIDNNLQRIADKVCEDNITTRE